MSLSARSLALACLAVAVAALALTACGSADSGRADIEAAPARCETVPVEGSYDKVRLENSAIPCQQATSMIYVLSTRSSTQTVVARGEGPWTCLVLPPSKRPLEVRCHRGRRHFSVERR
jgi:hypothetical protein